jgi:diguanylate cyclase (GGDEF)-like protein/putative nucleotidyltransferase with HDIG domain
MATSVRRPRLLVLVYATSLLLVATTVAGIVVVVNQHLTVATLNATAASDHALVAGFVRDSLEERDLAGPMSAGRRGALDSLLQRFAADHRLLALVVHGADGALRAASTGGAATEVLAPERLGAAREGHATVSMEPGSGASGDAPVVIELLPLMDPDGRLLGIVTLERDARPMLAAAAAAIRDILLIVGAGAVVLVGVLFLVFRAAQQLLTRRTAQLLESTRRDPLTGLLNHGAVVADLVTSMEAARSDAGWVIVALIDIDEFRLLNETHGHLAGDRALLLVADVLAREAPANAMLGRFGPDEFLLIGPPTCAHEMRPTIERVRERLSTEAIRFEGAEPMTVTVSAGVASYPEHAASATELLSVATAMLVEARTGGGNRVRVDAPDAATPLGHWSAFDVLEGLVVAVAAKDLYTKRHSEEVARFASFLADDLGLEDPPRETLRLAGLLHDVGKIGVPDRILRKPGPLSDEERGVMQQHTVIGDVITRSLPGMEVVALGVRHHHERWDGDGYPDRLAGSAIPLVARLVSVADAFSAMTTSRSYRKALSVDEALRRIAEGAGTQFDPTLAEAFVHGVGSLAGGSRPYDDDEELARAFSLRERMA